MRELTFLGFLTQYVRQLSTQNTTSLYKLAAEAGSDNPRLREPLVLYALFSQKTQVLLRAAKNAELRQYYTDFLQKYNKEQVMLALQTHAEQLPEEYHKVWRSYLSVKNRGQADDHTKELIRGKIRRLQNQTGITNYRLYADLGLNPGNVNAWLKHGNSKKVSLNTARRMLRYIESAESRTLHTL